LSRKIRVGLLFGGRSGEHEVSLVSAQSLLEALDPKKYEVVPIGITRTGEWRVGSEALKLLPAVLEQGARVIPSADPQRPGLIHVNANSAGTSGTRLDVVFPVLHGTFGEDGTVQGLLELTDIPYVGAGVLASAVGMDKDVMKRLFREAGLPVVEWVCVLRSDWTSSPERAARQIEKALRYPVFVKPANLGSSVGISKVGRRTELRPAMELAARYDRKIIVEQGLDAREIECSVLGNDHPEASVPGEVVPVNEFYDYEAKYIKEGSELIVPANLTPQQSRRVRDLAIRAFKAVDGSGMARVDFLMVRRTGRIFLNELNTIPGFTPISMYPKMWEASGLPYRKLLDRLIALALERHRDKRRTEYAYKLPS
jgi:D-alanine-D-alanine ligase